MSEQGEYGRFWEWLEDEKLNNDIYHDLYMLNLSDKVAKDGSVRLLDWEEYKDLCEEQDD